jgi:hypothetical protein
MAVVNRNTLVLNRVSVLGGVVTSTVGMGVASARGQATTIPFSMRPPSHAYPQAGHETSPRQELADRDGADLAADRAGRSGCSGLLVLAGLQWPQARGGASPTAAWRLGRFTTEHRASVGNTAPRRFLASRIARKRVKTGLAGLKPAGGAFPTSARGVGF